LFLILENIIILVMMNEPGIKTADESCILADKNQQTNIEGVFAAGDCTCSGMQVIIAAGDGARAGDAAIYYLKTFKQLERSPSNRTNDRTRIGDLLKLLKIRDVMVKEVITANVDFTVKYAVEIMSRCGIGCLLVTDGEKAVGIVTERDILSRVVAKEKNTGKTFVGEIISTQMIVIGPEASLEDAVKLMFRHRIKKLPVVEERFGGARLVGLVTLTDITRVQPKLLKTLRELFAELGEAPPRSMKKVIKYYIV